MSQPAGDEAAGLLEEMRRLSAEVAPGAAGARAELGGLLDRDYGFDSLARMELLSRLERRFSVILPEQVMADADTGTDLLGALRTAAGKPPMPVMAAPLTPARGDQDRSLANVTEFTSLGGALAWHAERHPDRVHATLLDDGLEPLAAPLPVTYGNLFDRARAVAAGLQVRGVGAGDSVAIMLPTGADYLATFCGISLAGAVPVPVYPPARPSQIEDHLRRHNEILANAQAKVLVSFGPAMPVARLLSAHSEHLAHCVTVDELAESPAGAVINPGGAGDLAFLQYTSGSTGTPKGVSLSNANVIASLDYMGRGLRVTEDEVFVSWLPLYHDMGLIGAWLGAMLHGFPLVLMSPLSFLARPQAWLNAITRYGGTLSGGPNFAYELCLRRIDEQARAELDLSSWRCAFNGAEPVSPVTMEGFARQFAASGFQRKALSPVYGLAEATLGVTFTNVGDGPRYDHVDRERWQRDAIARPKPALDLGAALGADDVLTHVSCGGPIPGFDVRVVSEAGRDLPEREEGRVWFSSLAATAGYFRNAAATDELIRAGRWLESGDRGYLADGELYLTGRSKDVIIRAGRNLYPYELEVAAGEVPGVRAGCVAVFGAGDAAAGTEKLVVAAETRERDEAAREQIRSAIRERSAELLGIPADEIVLVPPHGVLKTSSGKIRRRAMGQLHARGELGKRVRAPWLQLASLAMTGLPGGLRRGLRRLADAAFCGWGFVVLGVIGGLGLLSAWFLADSRLLWRVLRVLAKAMLAATGTRLSVELQDGAAPTAASGGGPVMQVANHSSYLDGLMIIAASDRPARFVAKADLGRHGIAGPFLHSLGVLFVERFERGRAQSNTAPVVEALRSGEAAFVFPEGTFATSAGLLPFQMGAFIAAVDANAPVQPITIGGTRAMLRGDVMWLRPGNVHVTVHAPIPAAGEVAPEDTFSAAVKLRDAARAVILEASGEPDLAARQALQELRERQQGS